MTRTKVLPWHKFDRAESTEVCVCQFGRNEVKTRFVGQHFEHLYRGCKAGRMTEADLRQDFGEAGYRVITHFETELRRRVRAPEGERDGRG